MLKNTFSIDINDRQYGQILGIKINSTSTAKVLARVREFISHNRKFYIVTPNPEIILLSQKEAGLYKSMNNADISVPDGVGIAYAFKFLYGRNINIIPGRKLFINLIELSNTKGWKVFFLGGEGNEARLAREKLGLNYKKIKIESFRGPILSKMGIPITESDKTLDKEAIKRINGFAPQILFVAFNNPKQEIWLHRNLESLNIGGGMVVGGTFRYISGLSKLPPRWMEKSGLEWLWRVITEPKRIGRIINAAIVFPWKVFLYKLSQ